MPPYIKKVLQNGLRIILVPLSDTPTVTVMVLAETGSEYEEKSKNGISHFLEHMCFKGTERRLSSEIINNELDGLGAHSNAFTSNNHTGFFAKAHAEKTTEMLDIVSDIYLNSNFPEAEIEKEKGVVIEEINMYEDQPQHKVWEILGEALFGDQPAGRTILGTKESVSSISRDDLISYHKKNYVPESTVVVVSGKIDSEKILVDIERIFGSIPHAVSPKRPTVKDDQENVVVKIHNKKSDQAHIVMAFRTGINIYEDVKDFKAGLLAAILGKGMSSRLFRKIREELGLAYYVSSSHHSELDYGIFTFSMGVSKKNIEKGISAVCDEIKKIKSELVSEVELKRVKELRKGHFYMSLETSNDWADYYGFQELHHEKILSPEEVIAKRDAITNQEVKELAEEIFRKEKLTIAIVGDEVDESKVYDSISL